MNGYKIVGFIGLISSLLVLAICIYVSNLINMQYLISVTGWSETWTYFMCAPSYFILGIIFCLSLVCIFLPKK